MTPLRIGLALGPVPTPPRNMPGGIIKNNTKLIEGTRPDSLALEKYESSSTLEQRHI